MSAKLNVNGKMYPIVESMGYNHSAGVYAAVVKDGDVERVAVWDKGGRADARFWTAKDRMSGGRMSMGIGQ